jgi:hypothetical protein
MTDNSNGEYFEKPWYRSRKFLAFIITQAALISIMVTTLVTQTIGWELSAYMTGVVVVMGWTTTLFMGKQAECDMFMRGITALGQVPDRFKSRFPNLVENVAEAKEKSATTDSSPS